MDKYISSAANRQVKLVRELLQRAKARRDSGCFVAEGERLCREIPKERLRQLFISEQYRGALPEMDTDTELFRVRAEVFERMADTRQSQGIIALVAQPKWSWGEAQRAQARTEGLYLILEQVQDPGNLGTILRTAEAAGVNGVWLDKGCVDLCSPKVVRASMGTIFRLPVYQTDTAAQAVSLLRREGVRCYAAHLAGRRTLYELPLEVPSAFLLGNEGNGLSEALAALADEKIRIPMRGPTESLNVAMAGGILVYEALRQRGGSSGH